MSDYSEKNVDELQDELRERDLKVSGNKDELIERLEADDAEKSNVDGNRSTGDGQSEPKDQTADAPAVADENPDDPATEKVLEADESVAEEANPNPTSDDDSDDEDDLVTAEDVREKPGLGPGQRQVVQQDGWAVQQGNWRKGRAPEDTPDNDEESDS